MWQLDWAHPKFGSILASCSYDRKVIIWKETNGTWGKLHEFREHKSSGENTRGALPCTKSTCKHTHNLTQITPSLPPHTHCHPTVNSIQWAPHEWGLILACGSADESISFLYYTGELYSVLSKLFTLSYPGSHPIYLLFHTPYPSSIPPSPSFPPPSCLPFLPSYLPSFLPLLLPPSFPLTPLPPLFSSSPLLSLP